MKKLLFLAVAIASVTSLSSCKKDYTCSCTYDDGLGGTGTFAAEYTGVKKADAEEACDLVESASAGYYTCELAAK